MIESVTRLLHEPNLLPDIDTDDLWCWLYVDANYGGASMFLQLSPGWVYWAESYVGDAMNDKISSLVGSCTSDEIGGRIFACSRTLGSGVGTRTTTSPSQRGFRGGLAKTCPMSVIASTTSPHRYCWFDDSLTRHDLCRSSGLIPQSDIAALVNAQSNVSSAGNATLHLGALWPTGESDSGWHPDDPSKTFIEVLIPINVDLPVVSSEPTRARSATGSTSTLTTMATCRDTWTTSGDTRSQGGSDHRRASRTACTSKIPGTIGQVNSMISDALSLANFGGPYATSATTCPEPTSSRDPPGIDVTVVLVKR